MLNWFKKKNRDCTHTANLTPAEDFAIAESEYAASNLVHAAYHLGCALSSDPEKPEYLALLDRMSDVSRNPLDLAPEGEQNYFATMAVRAYLLHRLNRMGDAVNLILQVVENKPDVPYLKWAIRWVQEPGAVGRTEMGVLGFFSRVMQEKAQAWSADRATARATLDLLPQFIEALVRAGCRDVHSLYAGAVAVRRLGLIEDAVRLGELLYGAQPSYELAVAWAYALREADRLDEAYEAFRRATAHKPEEGAVHLDMGDMRYQAEDWEGALTHYDFVLRQAPRHVWALPSSYASRFHSTGDAGWSEALKRLAEAGNERARALVREFGTDFQTYLPETTEACINLAEQLLERFGGKPHEMPHSPVKCTMSAIEPPSALLAVRCQLRLAGFPQPPIFNIERVATPDPRKPWGKAEVVLWSYQEMTPTPSFPPPSGDTVIAISRIASQTYRLDTWRDWGKAIAAELGPIPVTQLLGAMVNPPDPPNGMRAWTWINRFQLAASFIIAGREEGWAGTERRRILLSLARGPLDWTVDHALIVLASIASAVPESVPEIAELHLDRFRGVPREGAVCYLPTLCLAALERPGIQPIEREHWLDILQKISAA